MSIGQRLASQHLAMEKLTLASYPQTELIHWCHCKYPCEFRTVCLNLLILFMTMPQVKMYDLGLMQHQKGNYILTLQLLHCSRDVGNYVGTIPTLPWSRFALYNTMQFSSESLTLFLRVLRLEGLLASNIWKYEHQNHIHMILYQFSRL